MLYIHTRNTDSTTEITIRNRLFHLIVLDSVSEEETCRLWNEFYCALQSLCDDDHKEDVIFFIHYLWWEKSMVGAIFITADALQILNGTGADVIQVLSEHEKRQVNVPYCSIFREIFDHVDFEKRKGPSTRIVTTLDDENTAVTVKINNGDPILCCGFAEV